MDEQQVWPKRRGCAEPDAQLKGLSYRLQPDHGCGAQEIPIGDLNSDVDGILKYKNSHQRPSNSPNFLNVEVQRELVRMRSQTDGVDFFKPLVLEPGFEEVFREDITFHQIRVVVFEG